MAHYYIDNQPSVGYVVAQLDTSGLDDGYLSNRYVRNFGDRQSDAIEDYLYGHELTDSEVGDRVADLDLDDSEEADYIIDHHHTMPNRYGYRFGTLQQLKRAVRSLRKAAIYAQRADWLLCGDDSEGTFMQRLFTDLKDIAQGRQVDY